MSGQTTPRRITADEVRVGQVVIPSPHVPPLPVNETNINFVRHVARRDGAVTLVSDAPTEDREPTAAYRVRYEDEKARRELAERQRDDAIAHVHALKASHQGLVELLDDADVAGRRVVSVKRLLRIVNKGVDRG